MPICVTGKLAKIWNICQVGFNEGVWCGAVSLDTLSSNVERSARTYSKISGKEFYAKTTSFRYSMGADLASPFMALKSRFKSVAALARV
jgi:hypothetical protein